MRGANLVKGFLTVVVVAAVAFTIVNLGAQEMKKHEPQKLTVEQKTMMKNMAMKNMDKFMATKDAMMGLPMHLKKTQDDAISWGEELFNDKKALSTNGQACASCHPGGGTTGGEAETPMPSEATGKPYKLPIPTLVGAAATFPKYKVPNDQVIDLTDMQNNCMMMFMAAQPPAKNSKESRALTAYVSSLSNDDKVSVGKVPEMMMKMMSKMKNMDNMGKK